MTLQAPTLVEQLKGATRSGCNKSRESSIYPNLEVQQAQVPSASNTKYNLPDEHIAQVHTFRLHKIIEISKILEAE